MSKLPTTLWGAINRAKLDLRKYHLEEDPKKKEALKKKAVESMRNADTVVGPGPHRFISSRHNWQNEILFLNYYEDNPKVGRYWEDDQVQWSLECIPMWAKNENMKIQEPQKGTEYFIRGKQFVYGTRPEHHDR